MTLDRADFDALVERLQDAAVDWLSGPVTDAGPEFNGKTNVKLYDPSGNVIELKYYPPGERLAPA